MTPRVSEAAIIRAAERGARTPGRAWQRGACLRYGEGRARVWMDVNEDKVSYYKLAFKPFFTCIFESCAGSPCGFIHLFYTRSAAPLRG